jgi:multiple sugar transport system substrate-binding protein
MDRLSLSVSGSEGNGSGIDRRRFLKTTAGAAAGIAGSLSAPYVNAQSGITLRFLNAETTAASQTVLRNACNE